ncbi:DUF2807 domain-containing protein [Cellulophaga baltica]|uniref:head GIN domain-containing protein n=1 Tax=Cellulophaga TaxID=104264 RepID=UPI001C075EDD|nr:MULTISPECIES: head GIN domain-containing protein [Cellulophaga]MBU2995106.1 DUF2807 domain-containing protein [Cellulophaga baltica]MDO6766501.1 head GIN domain-containing protein [Cellulophaga sp. 1_MG-2023]
MMKKYFILTLICLIFFGCDSESVSDCFQSSGDIIQEEITLESFTKITVFQNVKLILKDGDEQKVILETGENLRNDISLEVSDDRLIVTNDNSCNFVRDYELTIVYVTSPNISEIRSSTGYPIESDGVLNYDSLSLLSESFGDEEADTTDGEFDLELNSTSVSVVANGVSYYQLSGEVENLSINFAADDSRIEAETLIAKNVTVTHRGSNDMLVYPVESLTGTITGTGDVVSYNVPTTVSVGEYYKGELIYKD